ncbi:MAG TPA: hypothetical protein VFF06_06440 [Polyangia bacterium]|nr:hypothetical protein [Polyangia bacterium]
MRLLTAHKILVSAWLVLCAVMIVWGVVHAVLRREPHAWMVLAMGAVALPPGALYLRKLYRTPPIR